MKKTWILCLLIIAQLSLQAQPVQWNAAEIKSHLEKLNVLGSVLYIAAHPDDENTRLLAYLSNGKLYRTAYLSCTRGDGGQNLIGSEQGSALGLIRTQELLAARRTDGAEQFFTRANDFGFSKNAKETLHFWDHDRVLSDVVWVIRKYQPDILITRFPEDARAGHGHHWTSAILAHEAFKAAADPSKFPEQLKYVSTWQPKRLLWNTYRFGNRNTTAADQFHMEIGGFNPLLGKSYGELAAQSRSMHKSQGFGSSASRTNSLEYFKTIAGSAPKTGLLDDVNTTWSRVEGGSAIENMIAAAIQDFKVDAPEKSIPGLLKIYTRIKALPKSHWRDEKLKESKKILTACLALFADASISEPVLAAGSSVPVHVSLVNRSDVNVQLTGLSLGGKDYQVGKQLQRGEGFNTTKTLQVSDTEKITEPYWLGLPHPIGYYKLSNKLLIGRPENPAPYQVQIHIKVNNIPIELCRDVKYKHTDDVKGELYQPMVIAPKVVVNPGQPVYLFNADQREKSIGIQVQGFQDELKGTLHLDVPPPFKVLNNDQSFELKKKGDELNRQFTVRMDQRVDSSASLVARLSVHSGGKSYDKGMVTIKHEHIPTITYFPAATTHIVAMDLKTGTGKEIGYIEGAGDLIPEALTALGYHVTVIRTAGISQQVLDKFDAIITGIRAYNMNSLLRPLQPKLMEYVKRGGVMLVQYNKDAHLVTDKLGPYPFALSNDRVTQEDATVTFLDPTNPAMNYPNKLSQRDFEGWIQERGLYFTTQADPAYKKLFSMHDTDSEPLDGSTLVCQYGKGKYVYSSLDFFRELPAGIPGAFRLFVNLITKVP